MIKVTNRTFDLSLRTSDSADKTGFVPATNPADDSFQTTKPFSNPQITATKHLSFLDWLFPAIKKFRRRGEIY